jgi:AcrR family transcriptional regulator
VGAVAAEEHDSQGPLGDELGPLPAGRHGYTPEEVAHNQRERLLAAVAQVVDERGYNAVTVTQITEAASVSRRVFYENFADKQACFLAAFEVLVEHLRETMLAAAEPEPDWPHQLIAALRALLEFLAAEPLLARLLLVESVSAGSDVAASFRSGVISFAPYLRAGRAQRSKAKQLPASTEDSLLGAVASLLSRTIAAAQPLDVPRLTGELAEFLLAPYVGAKQAAALAEAAS